MKFNLDELISKSFEGKEKVSSGFSQSVIEKMQEASGKTRRKNKGVLVAACVGMVLVTGVAVFAWGNSLDQQQTKKSQILSEKTEIPHSVNKDSNRENNERNAKRTKKEDGTKSENVENENAEEIQEEDLSRNPIKNAESKNRRKDETRKITDNARIKKSIKNDISKQTKKWKEVSDKTRDRESSVNQKHPVCTKKPPSDESSKPSVSSTPNITVPVISAGNYVDLCNMKMAIPEKQDSSDVQMVLGELYSDDLFGDQKVTSYEQLQALIEKATKECDTWETTMAGWGLKWIVQQLEQYDKKFFEDNALYINKIFLTYGYDFKLSAVDVKEEDNGKKSLNIKLDEIWTIGEDCAAPAVMVYYCCFVQVPKSVADGCTSVSWTPSGF